MYQYDDYDRTLVTERVDQFRDQVARRLSGALSEEEFRPLRLMNGLYLQLHAYMLRIAIPYGVLSARQLRMLAHIARTFDRGYGHFTTRQNIQFNWMQLVEVPDVLAHLAAVDMHAIQTSGNCIRNVTADPYAGVAGDEIEDPRIWAEIVRQWSTLHPEFSFLPRKFKIALTGSPADRAAVGVHDIGLRMRRDAAGVIGFEVIVGGGQGRTPVVGVTIRDFLPKRGLLAYLEAILRVYNLLGRRDNIFKARIKILVRDVGPASFAEMVEDEFRRIGESGFPATDAQRIRARFAPPAWDLLPPGDPGFDAARRADPAFDRWCRINLAPHRQAGYAIVNIALKDPAAPPGDATAAQMDMVADLAARFSLGEVRVTYTQNLVLPHVRLSDVHAVWQALGAAGLASASLGLIGDIVACPGLDYCSLANARSIPVAQRIAERFRDPERQAAIGELRLNISGCINACGHHHVGHIGILGVDRKGEEAYQVTLGGNADGTAALGEVLGPAFSADGVVDAVERIVGLYLERRESGERFLDTWRRLGTRFFKEHVYDASHA